jgi:hypothetical protein
VPHRSDQLTLNTISLNSDILNHYVFFTIAGETLRITRWLTRSRSHYWGDKIVSQYILGFNDTQSSSFSIVFILHTHQQLLWVLGHIRSHFPDLISIPMSNCRTSVQCNSVRKPYAILPDTLGDLISASKYLQTLPDPPGAKQCALRLCKRFVRCSWKHLQLWRCIQDALSRIVNIGAPETSAQICGRLP